MIFTAGGYSFNVSEMESVTQSSGIDYDIVRYVDGSTRLNIAGSGESTVNITATHYPHLALYDRRETAISQNIGLVRSNQSTRTKQVIIDEVKNQKGYILSNTGSITGGYIVTDISVTEENMNNFNADTITYNITLLDASNL